MPYGRALNTFMHITFLTFQPYFLNFFHALTFLMKVFVIFCRRNFEGVAVVDDVMLTSLDDDALVLGKTDVFSLRVSRDLLRPFIKTNNSIIKLHIWSNIFGSDLEHLLGILRKNVFYFYQTNMKIIHFFV